MSHITAIIVAGGSGKRMGTAVKKQYIELAGKPILAHTIAAFQSCEQVDEIVVVVGEEDKEKVKEEIVKREGFSKVKAIVAGGKERQDSVYNGLQEVSTQTQYVMVHDGARPFVTEEILKKAIEVVKETKAVVVAVPVKDTIKRVATQTAEVIETPHRETLWAVQTPQCFEKTLLLEAYKDATEKKRQVTDDSMLVEALGVKVKVVRGEYTNIKVTTPEDLLLGEGILSQKK